MSITLDLPPRLQYEIEARAAARGLNVEEVLLEAIESYLGKPAGYVPLEVRRAYGQAQIRALCAARGIEYDALTEEEHDQLVHELVHEARNAPDSGL